MRKLAVLLVLCAVASLVGHAQSPRVEVQMTKFGFGQFFQQKAVSDSLQQALQQSVEEQQRKAAAQKAEEERILAIKKEAEPICKQITKTEDSKFLCIVKAIFLGGKFPWESEAQYKLRLEVSTWPAAQPYK